MSDFNGDGKLDLVAVGPDYDRGAVGTVSVLLNQGDGTFQTIVNHGAGPHPTSVAVSDFNADGIPDLAVGSSGFSPVLSLLLGNGDGTFQSVAMNVPAATVAVGDFNGDGKADLASTDRYLSTNLSVSLNTGVSASFVLTFAQIGEFPAYGYGGSVAMGDFNGDGTPDLAVGDGDPSGYISVLLGKGDGTLQGPVRYQAGPRSSQVAIGDFNGDGKLDLAAASPGEPDSTSQTYTNGGIAVLIGNGDGTFRNAINYGTGNDPRGSILVVVGDFNSDGKLDLAAANSGSVFVLLGQGDGSFLRPVMVHGGENLSGLAVGDFNGDGRPDLVVASRNADVIVALLLGKGDGTFQTAINYAAGAATIWPPSVAVADFNRDGKPDLAVSKSGSLTNGGVSVLLGNGDGTFQAAVGYNAISAASLAVGDLNGDGKPDLVAVGHGISFNPGGTSVLMGNGDGTFQAAVTFTGHSITSVVVGDFNGDGKLDFVTVYSDDLAGTPATVWLNSSCSAGPQLAVVRSGAALSISWPFPSVGYVLESSASLDPTTWKPAGTLPLNNNGRWEATIPITDRQDYFRLRKP